MSLDDPKRPGRNPTLSLRHNVTVGYLYFIHPIALILAALGGFAVGAPAGSALADLSAACALWLAAIIAVRRDWRSKRAAPFDAQSAP